MRLLRLSLLVLACGLVPAASWSAMRIGALPAADSLALYVAAEERLFSEHGLEVAIVPFQSALEQAAAVRAGALEGYFGDIMNVLLMHESGIPQEIIATTSYSGGGGDETHATGGRYFGIAVAPDSPHTAIGDMAGANIAIGRSTIVDYMLDCMLESRGLPSGHVNHVDIRQIPLRMQMLLNGKIDGAVLPEPLLSLVEAQGARVVLDNRRLSMPLAVVALNKDRAKPETVQAFQAALAEAIRRINAEPETYKAMMLDKKLLPRGAAGTYAMVRFDPEHTPLPLPSVDAIEHVAAWMVRGNMLRTLPRAEAVLP
jgi:ABC-type nitrate/sulfonate/bicarbonate transport systems, periplasmic components